VGVLSRQFGLYGRGGGEKLIEPKQCNGRIPELVKLLRIRKEPHALVAQGLKS
jgi:hypothetical protein